MGLKKIEVLSKESRINLSEDAFVGVINHLLFRHVCPTHEGQVYETKKDDDGDIVHYQYLITDSTFLQGNRIGTSASADKKGRIPTGIIPEYLSNANIHTSSNSSIFKGLSKEHSGRTNAFINQVHHLAGLTGIRSVLLCSHRQRPAGAFTLRSVSQFRDQMVELLNRKSSRVKEYEGEEERLTAGVGQWAERRLRNWVGQRF